MGERACSAYTDFNPRSPCGERHIPPKVSVKVAVISIHAPRVGSDVSALSRPFS